LPLSKDVVLKDAGGDAVPTRELTAPRAETPYRPEIDGLRALAVLAGVGFHASPRFVPGGFVGVDVFFVISGFLISGIIFAQLRSGTFSFADFYARRIRRIVPALVVVLAACWAIGWFVLVGDEYFQLQRHIAGGAAFLSNFLLWLEAGYFDLPSESKPLLHLWSLGIEEQFYLIWPPLLYLCWTRRLNILSVAAAIIVFSLALNVALIAHYAVADFYLPTSRMWELLAGGVLAYIEQFRKGDVDRIVQRTIFTSGAPHDEQAIANLKGWVGLALILTAVLALEKSTAYPGWWFRVPVLHDLARVVGLDQGPAYPGWWALLPVIGTVLMIWAGPSAWANRTIRRHSAYLSETCRIFRTNGTRTLSRSQGSN
jgi:peptidoglycan/LPS O-acetylase OafA/YrhL